MSPGNILLLLAFQAVGEFLHRVLLVPLSGPLLGMTLLFMVLVAAGGPSAGLQATTRPLLACLALLFVPAGVGVVAHLDLLAAFWLPILAATIGGAIVSLLVTAGTFLLVERLLRPVPSGRPHGVQTAGGSATAAFDPVNGER